MGMREGDNKQGIPILPPEQFAQVVLGGRAGTLWSAIRCSKAEAQVDDMANDLLDKIPEWLKSLWHMENELRNAARNGLILRKDEASAHLAEARRHLEKAMNEAKGIEPPNGPQTPLRKEGEI
jgi:hypothetical protein